MGYGDAARIKTRSGVSYSDLGLTDEAALTTLISDLNDQASEMVDDYCGRDFEQHGTVETPVIEKLDGNGREKIRLPGFPVISVSSVILDGEVLTRGTDYDLLAASGILERVDFGVWRSGKRNLEVEYVYGYAPPPASIIGVVEDMVAGGLTHAARNRAVKGASSMSMDGFSVAYTELARNLVLAPEQMVILDRHRVTGGT